MGISQEAVQQSFNSLKGLAEALIGNAGQLTELVEQLQRVMQNATKALEDCAADLQTMGSMVTDYANGRYKEIPKETIVAVVAAIVYVVSPIDLIPDAIPVVGYADDAALVSFVLSHVHKDIESYRNWKKPNRAKTVTERSNHGLRSQ